MRKQRSLSACLCIVLLETCTTPSCEPLHYEEVLQETHTEETILKYFHEWEEAGGLLRPNSTFTLWNTSHENLCITTPDSWKGNALRAKSEFKKKALEAIKANEYTSSIPHEKQNGEYHVFLDGKEWNTSASMQTTPYHSLCILDLSGDAQKEDALEVMSHSFQEWLHESNLTATSTWRCILVGRTRDTAQNLGTIVLGNQSPAESYLHAQEQFKKIVFPDHLDPKGSAIIEALHYGYSLCEENGNLPQAVYISSDMREINHVFDFSKSIPDTQEFRKWLQKEAMTIDFHQASIHVHGISHTTTGRGREYTAREYEDLIHFWRTYFQETKAGTITLTSREGGRP